MDTFRNFSSKEYETFMYLLYQTNVLYPLSASRKIQTSTPLIRTLTLHKWVLLFCNYKNGLYDSSETWNLKIQFLTSNDTFWYKINIDTKKHKIWLKWDWNLALISVLNHSAYPSWITTNYKPYLEPEICPARAPIYQLERLSR